MRCRACSGSGLIEFLRQWESWRVVTKKFTEVDEGFVMVEVAQFHVHHDRDAVLAAAALPEP